jgi:hypothetical protein
VAGSNRRGPKDAHRPASQRLVMVRTGIGPYKNLVVPGSTPTKLRPGAVWEKCQMQLQTCELGKPQILGADCRGPGDESPGKIVEQWLTRHPIDRKGVRATYRLRGARPSEDLAERPDRVAAERHTLQSCRKILDANVIRCQLHTFSGSLSLQHPQVSYRLFRPRPLRSTFSWS